MWAKLPEATGVLVGGSALSSDVSSLGRDSVRGEESYARTDLMR